VRSRPALKVYIAPSPARPGDTLQVSAVLTSRRATPVAAVEFRLRCTERTTVPQDRSASVFEEQHFSLVARHAGALLTPGEHRYGALFPLPRTTPATYESDLTRVACELEVRVEIPWWADRTGRYAVEVQPAAVVGVSAQPQLFATARRGPQGKELYAECSLDSVLLEPGGVVRGSLSLSNVSATRVERVTAALSLSEVQHAGGYRRSWVQGRYDFVLHEGRVADGEPIPFGLALPRSLPVSGRTRLVDVAWTLDIAAEGAWRTSTLLSIPVTLLPPGSLPRDGVRALPPAVGRDRRRLVWTPVAAQLGLTYDADADAIRGRAGDVALAIAVEQRVRDGLFTTATLSWPSLGIALSVGPSRWSDRFTEREIDVGDAAFDARFQVRGRFAEQVRALLDADVRARIPPEADTRIDDAGATLSAPGALADPAAITAFARAVTRLAQAFDAAVRALPPPPAMRPYADAWRAFAERARARYSPGPCAVAGGRFGVDRFDVACQWSDAGELAATVVTLHLDPTLAAAPDEAQRAEALAAVRAVRPDASLAATAEALTCALPTLTEEPATLEPLLDVIARAGRKLQGRADAAPYR
jgi:hypothetical protein